VYAVIGLGNPGSEYDETRHNVGFAVLDALAATFKIKLKSTAGEYLLGKAIINGVPNLFVKPLTYMNNSGIAVQQIASYYKIPFDHLLVVVDDFQIPLGTLRIRLHGSDGGHHGMASIVSELGTNKFPRIRCGIRGATMPNNKGELARYVLEPFERNERTIVQKMIETARDATIVAITEGIHIAMNKFNSRITEPYSHPRLPRSEP
jgi:PTH1 family peptidyl-tRNA hydrolase